MTFGRFLRITSELLSLFYKCKITHRGKEKIRKRAKETRKTLERLGSVFVKFGQLLSMRPDLIPQEYCDELFYLLEEAQPLTKEEVETAFKESFNKNPNDLFTSFNYKPVGSASFGQVHEATTQKSERVAVKIQRPNVHNIVKRDITLMRLLSRLHDLFSPGQKTKHLIAEFESWTLQELDYKQEIANTKEFYKKNTNHERGVLAPKVHGKYSRKNIITFEFIDGFTIRKYLTARRNKDASFIRKARRQHFSEEKVGDTLFLNGITSIYIDGSFHADPHPANIMFSEGKLYYIDFGIVGTLTKEQRRHHLRYTRSCMAGDTDTAFKELLNFCEIRHHKKLEQMRKEHDKLLHEFLESFKKNPTTGAHLGIFLLASLKLLRKYRLNIPENRLRYFRTLITLQSVVNQINPKLTNQAIMQKFIAISLVNIADNFPEEIEKADWQKKLMKLINAID